MEEDKKPKEDLDTLLLDVGDMEDDVVKLFKTSILMQKLDKILNNGESNGNLGSIMQMMVTIPLIQRMVEEMKPKSKLERMMEKMQELVMFEKMKRELLKMTEVDEEKKDEKDETFIKILDKIENMVAKNQDNALLIEYLQNLERKIEETKNNSGAASVIQQFREFIQMKKQLAEMLREDYYELAPVKTEKGPDLLKLLAVLVSSLKDLSAKKRRKHVRIPPEPVAKEPPKINIQPNEIAEDKPFKEAEVVKEYTPENEQPPQEEQPEKIEEQPKEAGEQETEEQKEEVKEEQPQAEQTNELEEIEKDVDFYGGDDIPVELEEGEVKYTVNDNDEGTVFEVNLSNEIEPTEQKVIEQEKPEEKPMDTQPEPPQDIPEEPLPGPLVEEEPPEEPPKIKKRKRKSKKR